MHRLDPILLASALMWTATANAGQPALQQIHGSDATVPVAPYLAALVGGEDQQGVMQGMTFPLRTSLRQGVLTTEGVAVFNARWMTQPIVVMGTDWASLQWLQLHQDRLRGLGAAVIVVAAGSEDEFKALQRAAAGVPVAPAQSPWLESRMRAAGVAIYPVLIDLDGRARQIIFDGAEADLGKGTP